MNDPCKCGGEGKKDATRQTEPLTPQKQNAQSRLYVRQLLILISGKQCWDDDHRKVSEASDIVGCN